MLFVQKVLADGTAPVLASFESERNARAYAATVATSLARYRRAAVETGAVDPYAAVRAVVIPAVLSLDIRHLAFPDVYGAAYWQLAARLA